MSSGIDEYKLFMLSEKKKSLMKSLLLLWFHLHEILENAN